MTFIFSAGRTDFKRNLKKEGKTIRHIISRPAKELSMMRRSIPAKFRLAGFGNFNAGQFTKQLQLGAFIRRSIRNCAESDDAYLKQRGVRRAVGPALGPNGSWAVLRCVLVVGAEQQKPCRRSMVRCARRGGRLSHENGVWRFHVSQLIRGMRNLYREICATELTWLGLRGKIYAHAKLNPLAQMRDADLTFDCASQVSEKSRRRRPSRF